MDESRNQHCNEEGIQQLWKSESIGNQDLLEEPGKTNDNGKHTYYDNISESWIPKHVIDEGWYFRS